MHWGVWRQKKVPRAWVCNYIPQYLWDVITCPWPIYTCFWHNYPQIFSTKAIIHGIFPWCNHLCFIKTLLHDSTWFIDNRTVLCSIMVCRQIGRNQVCMMILTLIFIINFECQSVCFVLTIRLVGCLYPTEDRMTRLKGKAKFTVKKLQTLIGIVAI